MQIGKPLRTIVVEPLEDPVFEPAAPDPNPPSPSAPEPEPNAPESEPEQVPAKQ